MKALEKTFNMLRLFTPEHPSWGLLELSAAAELPASTLHRIVAVLKRYGLVVQDPDSKKYRLGYAAIELGRRAAAGLPVRQVAEPWMRRLAAETGETVVLTVLNDAHDRSICVERIESRHDLRLQMQVGSVNHLHAGASSKVLLAYLPESEVDLLIRQVGLPKLAPNTITDVARLKRELASIRAKGYAASREESDEGSWGVAAPILSSDGEAVAALGIALPVSRYSVEAQRRFVTLTVEGCRQVCGALGIRTLAAAG